MFVILVHLFIIFDLLNFLFKTVWIESCCSNSSHLRNNGHYFQCAAVNMSGTFLQRGQQMTSCWQLFVFGCFLYLNLRPWVSLHQRLHCKKCLQLQLLVDCNYFSRMFYSVEIEVTTGCSTISSHNMWVYGLVALLPCVIIMLLYGNTQKHRIYSIK